MPYKTKQLKKNNIQNLLFTWAFYYVLFVILITQSPYNFSCKSIGSFSWAINPLDTFQNLLLLSPVGFCLALSNQPFKYSFILKYTLLGFLLSIVIESGQLLLESRTSQYWDVITNTLSILFGLLVGLLFSPLFNRLNILSKSVISLLNVTFAILIFLIVRLIMNHQHFGLFEFSVLFLSLAPLNLMFSRSHKKNNESSIYKNSITTIIFIFISLSPLIIVNLQLVILIAFSFGLSSPFITYLIVRSYGISYFLKKTILVITSLLPLLICTIIFAFKILTNDVNFYFIYLDNTRPTSREIGGAWVQISLILIMMLHVTNYIRTTKKS